MSTQQTGQRMALLGGVAGVVGPIRFTQIPRAQIAIITRTTLICGRHDRVTPLRTAQRAATRHGWPLHMIDDAGHLSVAEQPQAFLNALRTAAGVGS